MKTALKIIALAVAIGGLIALVHYINKPPYFGPKGDGFNTGNRWTN